MGSELQPLDGLILPVISPAKATGTRRPCDFYMAESDRIEPDLAVTFLPFRFLSDGGRRPSVAARKAAKRDSRETVASRPS
jgi:hypothetical protein